jgi:hypothetical protein
MISTMTPDISIRTLDEDSPDLTDEDIRQAQPTGGADDVVQALKNLSCCSCAARPEPTSYALRRKASHFYWKVGLRCLEGHERILVFQTDWIGR